MLVVAVIIAAAWLGYQYSLGGWEKVFSLLPYLFVGALIGLVVRR